MTDERNLPPDIPAEDADEMMQVAAIVSGKEPGELSLDDAIKILEGTSALKASAAMKMLRENTEILNRTSIKLEKAARALTDNPTRKALQDAVAQSMKERAEITETLERTTAALREQLDEMSKMLTPAVLTGVISQFNSSHWQQLRETLQTINLAAPAVLNLIDETEELKPYLDEELKKDEYAGRSIETLFDEAEKDDDGIPAESSLFSQAIRAAREARDAATAKEEHPLPSVRYNQSTNIQLNIDKLSLILFDGRTVPSYQRRKDEIPGQLSFVPVPVSYERDGNDEITLIIKDLSFDNDTLSKSGLPGITDYEDLFYLAFIGNAFMNGNTLVSATKLYRDYFGTDPNSDQLSDFTDRLERLATTTTRINDRAVMQAWGKNDPQAKYREIVGSLAPIVVGSERFVANGKVSDTTIKIYDFPQVLRIGLEIGQFTTVPKTLLMVRDKNGRFVKRTGRFYRVLYYAIRRIAQIKNGTSVNKILYETFYSETGETTARDKQLALKTFFVILDHFKKEGWITGYKEEVTKSTGKAGVRFTWDNTPGKKRGRLIANKKKGSGK